jgi:16S rRNA processing protein RimM
VIDRPHWIAVGRITRAHGVNGEVAVMPLSEVDARFQPGSRLFVGESGRNRVIVRAARPHRNRLLVSFEGVIDRDRAEALGGQYLFVRAEEAPELPEGEYWTFQLVGCEVATESGRALGRLREVIHTQANDVWVVEGDGGEVLVPALKEVVVSVEAANGRIVVREIPGLTVP